MSNDTRPNLTQVQRGFVGPRGLPTQTAIGSTANRHREWLAFMARKRRRLLAGTDGDRDGQ